MARRHKAQDITGPELPITPMLDMAFQLMVFFILTYHPSALEVQIDGTLLPPKTTVTAAQTALPQNKQKTESVKDKPPDTEDNLVVRVEAFTAKDKVEKKNLGTPKRIRVQRPSPTTAAGSGGEVVMDKDDSLKEGLAKLRAQLRDFLASDPNAANTDVVINVIDTDLRWEYLNQIQDACKTRYGVAPSGKLVRLDSREQEKQFSKVVGFKNVSYLIPAEEGEAKPGG